MLVIALISHTHMGMPTVTFSYINSAELLPAVCTGHDQEAYKLEVPQIVVAFRTCPFDNAASLNATHCTCPIAVLIGIFAALLAHIEMKVNIVTFVFYV